ncbi:hypothetical protein MJD09_07025 [bacterium]|nr:hypothetical protein [bacterium]
MSLRIRREAALARQISTVENRLQKLNSSSNRFSWYRLFTVLTGVVVAIGLAYFPGDWFGWCAVAVTLVVFNIVAYYHRQIDRSIKRHEIWRVIKSRQIARMRLDWGSIPETTHQDPDPDHPFEVDLDVTGRCSLLQLVDISISRDGHERLKSWLLETRPQASVIKARQAVVKELVPLARFRDKLLLSFYLVSKAQFQGTKLLQWLQRQTHSESLKRVLSVSTGLAAVNILLFTLNQLDVLASFWIASLTVYGIIYFGNGRIRTSLFGDSNLLSEELQKFRVVLRYLEEYSYGRHSHLRDLCRPFCGKGEPPSKQLRNITWLSAAIGLRMNFIVRLLLNAAMPWDFFLVDRLNKTKSTLTKRLPAWLDVVTELEAQVSLANFGYVNPEYTFPEICPSADQAVFEATELGHPLIPYRQKVCNDFVFRNTSDIVLITGSNMSGKSTFLKTIGLNLSLAFAGGPVNATSLRTSLLRLYSCIKINDSVTGGFSFFYSEVKRLKGLLDRLKDDEDVPLLFLIDEIFKGTNNRERLIGSRSYIMSLSGQNGLGAVTTHDLELTNLSKEISGMSNYHFREEVHNGKMEFDFKLHSGPCPTTNALKIMRMEGLPVEDKDSVKMTG